MDIDSQQSNSPPPSERAKAHYDKALALKKEGKADAALTEFRRAVLADPDIASAHYEIGLLCKDRAQTEPIFYRYAFDALQKAVRLSPERADAHDQYIMIARKLNRLDELLVEYENLSKHQPDNELIKRCQKNILTISMAMMPEKIEIDNSGLSGRLKKIGIIISLVMILGGFALMILPAVLKSGGRDISPDTIRHSFGGGIAMGIVGIGGLFFTSRIK